jgi:small subunit ribosomal protein S6
MAKTATKASKDEATIPADEIELTRYELMTLVTPEASTLEYSKHVDTIKKLLADHGASLWHEEDWGKRELAYSIKKQEYAYYLILNFDMEPVQMPKVEEQLRIMNFVLRHLALKVPENYTPQEYDLDFEEDRSAKKEEVKKPAPRKKAAPVKVAEPAPAPEVEKTPEEVVAEEAAPEIKEEEVKAPVVEEAVKVEEVEEVAPAEVAEEPKAPEATPEPVVDVKSDKESKADLSKLDAKLEELLSGDDDLNL